ncbi:MAG: class I SAM-dependent methyltransferase [Bacteroidia bacterium]|nr:class I SAM-dependent methyltransferase [Bacteroidia bacterium]MCC6767853.1 class I SAM-dependent methyltransferase [Bacteroidia bacterium]
MSLYFHGNAPLKFQHQYLVTRDYIIPFIEKAKPLSRDTRVLEIGCGEGGVLLAFAEKGCHCTGMDLSESKIISGKTLLKDQPEIHLFTADIYDRKIMDEYKSSFDLIVLKDTIEHIPEQEKIMEHLPFFLKPGGMLFFAFPPWRMPFGGHQQTAVNKKAQFPWIHLLPRKTYINYLKKAGENEGTILSLTEIYDTRISINRFERIIRHLQLMVVRKRHYLINPIYRYKFRYTPREQFKIISAVPWLRDFFTTTVYYLLRPDKK